MDECQPLVDGGLNGGGAKTGGVNGEVNRIVNRMTNGGGSGEVNGGAVQVDPMKPTLKPPGTKRLKLKYDELLSNFAFKFNLRRCPMVRSMGRLMEGSMEGPRTVDQTETEWESGKTGERRRR